MVLFQQNERRWASIAGAGSGREAVFTAAAWRCRAQSHRGFLAQPLTPAGGAVEIAASADGAETLSRLEDVIARHLIRFGADGELEVTWVSSPAA